MADFAPRELRNFFLTAHALGQQQIGHVGASDEQHKGHRAEPEGHDLTAWNEVVLERLYRRPQPLSVPG